jgi:hypothetical protein
VPGLAADLPDPLVGLAPLLEDDAADAGEEVPEDLVDRAVVAAVEPGRVDQLAERVELELLRRAVADPDGTRAAVALDVVAAATIAPVGPFVSALRTSALRTTCSRYGP